MVSLSNVLLSEVEGYDRNQLVQRLLSHCYSAATRQGVLLVKIAAPVDW